MKLTRDEIEFLIFQLIARKDVFTDEMKNGIKSAVRMKEIMYAIDTIDKGIELLNSLKNYK